MEAERLTQTGIQKCALLDFLFSREVLRLSFVSLCVCMCICRLYGDALTANGIELCRSGVMHGCELPDDVGAGTELSSGTATPALSHLPSLRRSPALL